MQENLDRQISIAEAILSYPGNVATVKEIEIYCMKYHKNIFNKCKDIGTIICGYLHRKQQIFVRTQNKGRNKQWLWAVTPQWELQLEKQNDQVKPICFRCGRYTPIADPAPDYDGDPKIHFLETCATSSELITTAILSQPSERATVAQIRIFLQENLLWLSQDKKVWNVIRSLLCTRTMTFVPCYVNQWTITDSWRQQIERRCPQCTMVKVRAGKASHCFNNAEIPLRINEKPEIEIIDSNIPACNNYQPFSPPRHAPPGPWNPNWGYPNAQQCQSLYPQYRPVVRHPQSHPYHPPRWWDHNLPGPNFYPNCMGNPWNGHPMQIPRNYPPVRAIQHVRQWSPWEIQHHFYPHPLYPVHPEPPILVTTENAQNSTTETTIENDDYPLPPSISTMSPSVHELKADIPESDYPLYLNDGSTVNLIELDESNDWVYNCPTPTFVDASSLADNKKE